jgi:hypothetical protein
MPVKKIISGGQNGADRAGLDAALDLGLEHGGYCPAGRKAEDGIISWKYVIEETSSKGYESRTKLNVKHSDATVVFTQGALTPGSALTLTEAKLIGKPWLHVDIDDVEGIVKFRRWLSLLFSDSGLTVLNVAGSRESKAPGIGAKVRALLVAVLRRKEV